MNVSTKFDIIWWVVVRKCAETSKVWQMNEQTDGQMNTVLLKKNPCCLVAFIWFSCLWFWFMTKEKGPVITTEKSLWNICSVTNIAIEPPSLSISNMGGSKTLTCEPFILTSLSANQMDWRWFDGWCSSETDKESSAIVLVCNPNAMIIELKFASKSPTIKSNQKDTVIISLTTRRVPNFRRSHGCLIAQQRAQWCYRLHGCLIDQQRTQWCCRLHGCLIAQQRTQWCCGLHGCLIAQQRTQWCCGLHGCLIAKQRTQWWYRLHGCLIAQQRTQWWCRLHGCMIAQQRTQWCCRLHGCLIDQQRTQWWYRPHRCLLSSRGPNSGAESTHPRRQFSTNTSFTSH